MERLRSELFRKFRKFRKFQKGSRKSRKAGEMNFCLEKH